MRIELKKIRQLLSSNKHTLLLAGIVFAGLIMRFFLAKGQFNLDIQNAILNYQISKTGENLYKVQQAYNYSPLYYYVLIILGKISDLTNVGMHIWIRVFISLVDLGTLLLLIKIAKFLKKPVIVTAALFFLNPVSIIISGFHGQFDNITIFFLLAAYVVYILPKKTIKSKALILLLLALSVAMKHILIFHPLLLIRKIAKSNRAVLGLYLMLIVFFLLTFVPYIVEANQQIFKQVFQYDALGGFYGLSHIYLTICRTCSWHGILYHHLYKYLFVFSLLLFSLKFNYSNLIRAWLLLTLIFLVFTPGIGSQFFVLPIAFAALFPSRWFYLYSLAVTFFYFSYEGGIRLYPFALANWNTVWLVVICWCLYELKYAFKK